MKKRLMWGTEADSVSDYMHGEQHSEVQKSHMAALRLELRFTSSPDHQMSPSPAKWRAAETLEQRRRAVRGGCFAVTQRC